MSDWKFARKGSGCAVCSRSFRPGESFVSAIFEAAAEGGAEDEVARFERIDACPDCFSSVPGSPYSRWTTRLPEPEEKGPILDLGMAREFLVRLVREDVPERRGLAVILSLMLLRKRRVKLVGKTTGEDPPQLHLLVPGGEEEVELMVPSPEIGPEEAAELSAELDRLFGLVGPRKEEGAEDPGPPPAPRSSEA